MCNEPNPTLTQIACHCSCLIAHCPTPSACPGASALSYLFCGCRTEGQMDSWTAGTLHAAICGPCQPHPSVMDACRHFIVHRTQAAAAAVAAPRDDALRQHKQVQGLLRVRVRVRVWVLLHCLRNQIRCKLCAKAQLKCNLTTHRKMPGQSWKNCEISENTHSAARSQFQFALHPNSSLLPSSLLPSFPCIAEL